ncbi:MAG: DUF4097 domain-containing protein [Treponema sp.]|nr:DUF4097 domain-containing protein [Treponema sp.]
MKKNYILASLWIVIAVFLTFLLVRGFEASNNSIKSLKKLGHRIENEIDPEEFEDDYDDWDYEDSNFQAATEKNVFEVSQVENIDLEIKALPLEIKKSNDSKIHIDFIDGAEKYCKFSLSNNRLMLEEKKKGRKSFYYHSKGKVILTIPENYSGCMDVQAVSGSVKINEIKLDSLDLEAVSGSVNIYDSTILDLNINTVSGSINAEGNFDAIECETVSGSIKVKNVSQLKSNSKFESISGSVILELPEDSNYKIDYESMSGSFTDNLNNTSGKKSGTSVKGNGKVKISISTISGSIKIQ